MMSVLHYRKQQERTLNQNRHQRVSLPRPRQGRQLSVWETCLQQLLISSPTPSYQLQKCLQVFATYIQSNVTYSELDIIFQFMQKSISDCLQTNDIDLAKQEYETLANFVDNYLFKEKARDSWMENTATLHAILIHISNSLARLVRETAWNLFEKIRQYKCDKYKQNQLSAAELASLRNMISNILLILIKTEINIADIFLSLINHYWAELCSLSSDPIYTELSAGLTDMIEDLALMIEVQTTEFRKKLRDNQMSLNHQSTEYTFTRMLFLSYEARAKLAIRNEHFDVADQFLKHCNALKDRPNPDDQINQDCAMLKRLLIKTQQDKKQKNTPELGSFVDMSPSEPLRPTACPQDPEILLKAKTYCTKMESTGSRGQAAGRRDLKCQQSPKIHDEHHQGIDQEETVVPMVTEPASLAVTQHVNDEKHTPQPVVAIVRKKITHQERKKLNRIKKRELMLDLRQHQTQEQVCEINQRPRCMENPTLETLLNKISAMFNRSECEGLLFGSAIRSTQPGDFDILLPNINSRQDEDNVRQLIQLFVDDGGKLLLTTGDSGTLGLGYIKANRHVIPMIWNGMKIDFNVFNEIFPKHAEKLDWTLVMYYDLKHKILFRIKALHSIHDLNHKILNSITDARISFKTDPSRILRGVRLVGDEGFQFSQACLDAIGEAFAGDDNLFRSMKPYGKIYDQLSLLCHSDNAAKNAAGFARKNMEALNKLGLFFKIHDVLAERHTEPRAQQFLIFLRPYYREFKALSIESPNTLTALTHDPIRCNLTFGLFPSRPRVDAKDNPDHNPQNFIFS